MRFEINTPWAKHPDPTCVECKGEGVTQSRIDTGVYRFQFCDCVMPAAGPEKKEPEDTAVIKPFAELDDHILHENVKAFDPLPVPRGYDQIVKTFGQPGKVKMAKVNVPPVLTKQHLYLKRGYTYAHKLLEERLEWVFQQIVARGLEEHLESYDGCYNPRYKRGGRSWSTHAWAIAVDINQARNRPGMPNNIHPGIIELFTIAGFYQLKGDPMHFQYCTGY